MKLVSWIVRRLAYLVLVISTFSVGAAYAAPKICNSTNITISVAIAWYGSASPGLHSSGWTTLPPGGCKYPFPNDSYNAHRYYFAYNDAADLPDPARRYELTRAWTSDTYQGGQLSTGGWSFCTGGSGSTTGSIAFYFADAAYGSCSPPNLRRGFVHIDTNGVAFSAGEDPNADADVYLTWDNARLGNATW